MAPVVDTGAVPATVVDHTLVADTGAVLATVVDHTPVVGMAARAAVPTEAAVPIVVAVPTEAADPAVVVNMVADTES